MRQYTPDYSDIGISPNRYREIWYFLRQYPEWRTEADSLIRFGGGEMDGMPHATDTGDPVFRIAVKREKLLQKIQLVDRCAAEVEGGRWYIVLIQNCCMGKPIRYMPVEYLPTSKRVRYSMAKKEFYRLINEELEKREPSGR